MAALAVLAACTSPKPALSGSVSVLGSWSGEELAAFEEVVAPFEERTGVDVEYLATRDLRGRLEESLADGAPPDLAGLEGPAHLRELAAEGVLRDLRSVLDMGSYRGAVAPTFIDLGSVDRQLVGVFLRSSVKGLIWYSPQNFRLGTPRTWEELQRLALQSSERAAATWCVGLASEESSGWPGTDLIEQFLLRASGVAVYDAWAEGRLEWTSEEVARAFELYLQVVADDAVFGGAQGAIATDFRTAGEPLVREPPGCLFLHQGSFMPAYLASLGVEAGEDYDFFAFPDLGAGMSDAVIGGGDLFGLLTESRAAEELMRYLVSDEAQSLWVAQGGSLSVRASVTDYPDAISRRAADLLTSADTFRFDASDLMPGELNEAFWQAVLDVTAEPWRLDAELEELEAIRTGISGP